MSLRLVIPFALAYVAVLPRIRLLLNATHLSVQRRARRLVCSIAIALSFNNTRIFIALARSLTIKRARTDRFCRQVPVDDGLTVGASCKGA